MTYQGTAMPSEHGLELNIDGVGTTQALMFDGAEMSATTWAAWSDHAEPTPIVLDVVDTRHAPRRATGEPVTQRRQIERFGDSAPAATG